MTVPFDDAPRTRECWRALLDGEDLFGASEPGPALAALYGPLRERPSYAIGQMGQSLDGFIATRAGSSHYVTGPESLVHLHRLRALTDVVLVGATTVESDDPQLTVRHCEGTDPVRVVLDRRARLGADARVFAGDGRALRLVAEGASLGWEARHVETHVLPLDDAGHFDPALVLRTLASRSLPRVLVEGGGAVVSDFLRAGVLDRLHVVVAPFLMGDGVPSVRSRPVEDLPNVHRPPAGTWRCGGDVLFDLDLG